MTRQQWINLGVLGIGVVIVLCLGLALVFAALSAPRTLVVVLEVTSTPRALATTTSGLAATWTPPHLAAGGTPSSVAAKSGGGAELFLQDQKCITPYDTIVSVSCLVTFINPTDSVVGGVGATYRFFDSSGVSLGSQYDSASNLPTRMKK